MNQGSYDATIAPQALERNEIGGHLDTLATIGKKLISLNQRLTQQLSRWNGPVPTPVSPPSDKTEARSCHIDRLRMATSLIEQLVDDAIIKASELDKIG